MVRSFDDYLERKRREYGDKFDVSDLNPAFIPAYESGERITVDFGYETKRGIIGITTGWKPAFLLMLTKRSLGSSWLIGNKSRIIR